MERWKLVGGRELETLTMHLEVTAKMNYTVPIVASKMCL